MNENDAFPRALLLMGQAPEQVRQFHNQPEHWALLAEHLRAADLSARWMTDDLSVLNPRDLARFDVILNYSTALQPTAEQVAALLAAVEGGVGFVGLHAATATFTDHPDYLRMVGGRFQRHDPIKRFTIHFVDRDHPLTAGLEDYEHEDELYELTADLIDRQNVVPLSGVRILLGHPTYRTLFTRAIAWAARGGARSL